MKEVLYAVEGATDAPAAEKLIRLVGREPRVVFDSGGSSQLDERMPRWMSSTNRASMLILRDLDKGDHEGCVPSFVAQRVPEHCPPGVVLRVAVRAIEAWFLADAEHLRNFFGTKSVPADPEFLPNPKLELVRLCNSSSRRQIREGMVPRPGTHAAVGPQYTLLLREFAREAWDPEVAQRNAPSLRRAIDRMTRLVSSGTW